MEGEGQPDVGPPPMYNPYGDDRLMIEIEAPPPDRRASYNPAVVVGGVGVSVGVGGDQQERPRGRSQSHNNRNIAHPNPHDFSAFEGSRQRAPSRSPDLQPHHQPPPDYAYNHYSAKKARGSKGSDDAGSLRENSEVREARLWGDEGNENPHPVREHQGHSKSMVSLDREAAREVFRDEHSTQPPTQGVKLVMIFVSLILIFVIVGLFAAKSGVLVIVGVFGTVETVRWDYGYVGSNSQHGASKTYLDTYTKQAAADVGEFLLLGLLGSLGASAIAFYILCVRYNSNLPLYILCCNIRIPQRQTLNVLYGLVKGVFWITTMWYLIVCFHGLLEMNYYIDYNCVSGTCYTYILPNYGWVVQIAIVLFMSCCLYVKISNLDPPLRPLTVKFYYPEHAKIAESSRAPIKLTQVLLLQEITRKIMINAAVCWFMQRSGYISIANLEKGHNSNIVGVFIPIGWYNVRWSDAIDDTLNAGIVSAGTILGSVCAYVGWASLASSVYLMYVVVKFKAGKTRRTLFLLNASLMTLLWIFSGGLFYYQFYIYWRDGGKGAVPDLNTGMVDAGESTGSPTGAPTTTFWFPSWGFIFWALTVFYLIKLLKVAWSSL